MVKTLILGHGGHGKDTVAEQLRLLTGCEFQSSSLAAAEAIFDELNACLPISCYNNAPYYATPEAAYADRRNHRMLWKELISSYNAFDPARLAKRMLMQNDCYVGMRCAREFRASKDLFDQILYVDASPRVKTVDESMAIEFDPYSMILIDNSGAESDIPSELRYKLCIS